MPMRQTGSARPVPSFVFTPPAARDASANGKAFLRRLPLVGGPSVCRAAELTSELVEAVTRPGTRSGCTWTRNRDRLLAWLAANAIFLRQILRRVAAGAALPQSYRSRMAILNGDDQEDAAVDAIFSNGGS
jgi:hypothetical protein